jgi:hypothetical protein
MNSEDPFSPALPVRAPKSYLPLKILIGSAIGLVVGFGTCGLGASLNLKSQGATQILVPIGLILFVASVLGLIVSTVWLLVRLIVSMTRS